jgi:hypothetical protein
MREDGKSFSVDGESFSVDGKSKNRDGYFGSMIDLK